MCEAVLKRICRRKQIAKWPFRHLKSIAKKNAEVKRQLRSVDPSSQIDQYRTLVGEVASLVAERMAFYDKTPSKKDIDAELETEIDDELDDDMYLPPSSPSTTSPTTDKSNFEERAVIALPDNLLVPSTPLKNELVGSCEPSNVFD